jgi:hypothetical protein
MIHSGEYSIPASEVADAILRHAGRRGKVARPISSVPDLLEDG